MPFQGDAKTICSPNLRRLDSFDDSWDFYEDGDATELNWTKAAGGVFHIGVVGRQKTFVSCPFRAMRRLVSATIQTFRLFR